MARINKITEKFIPASDGFSPANMLGNAVNGLGESLFNLGDSIKRRDENAEFQDAQNKYTERMRVFEENAIKRGGAQAEGVTKDYESEHEAVFGEIFGGMKYGQSSHAFKQWSKEQYERAHLGWARTEHRETTRAALETWNTGLKEFEGRAQRNPYDLAPVVEDAEWHFAQAVDAGYMTKDEAAMKLDAFKEGLTDQALENAYAMDWQRVEKELQNDMWAVDPKVKARFLDRAKAQRKQIKAETDRKASDIKSGIPDAEAYFLESGDNSALVDIENRLRTIGRAGDASEVAKKRRITEKAHSVIRAGSDMPLMDQWEYVQKELAVDSTENASLKARAKDQAEKVIKARMQSFQKSPADFVASMVDPKLSAERQAERRLEIQKEIGKGIRFKPEVLTKEEAAVYQDAWEEADANGKLDILTRLNGFGAHRKAVLEQVGVPASTQIAAFMFWDNPMAKGDARVLITAATAKPSDIPKTGVTDSEVLNELEDSDVMSALRTVAKNQPGNVRFQGFVAEVEKTLINAAKISGDKATAAKLLDKHFASIIDDTTAIYFSPSKVPDMTALEVALKNKRASLGESLEYQREMFEKAGMPAEAFDERVGSIIDNGVWVNAPDGDGFVMLNPLDAGTGGSGAAVRLKDGDYFRLRYDDIDFWTLGTTFRFRAASKPENVRGR